ncbi:hypothetical protein NC652_028654 [Populus alba x Populus x berolinensis]|nr:hypothetical protein NC652_028654 [Populus alba x Populus x berolinensis]
MEMTANTKVRILAGYSDCSLCFKLLHQLDATLFIGRQQNPHLKRTDMGFVQDNVHLNSHVTHTFLNGADTYIYACTRTHVALVTSLRDGMNLVSYEFVACQDSKKGVLILSECENVALLVFLSFFCNYWCILLMDLFLFIALTFWLDMAGSDTFHDVCSCSNKQQLS